MQHAYIEVIDFSLIIGPYGDLRLGRGTFKLPAIIIVLVARVIALALVGIILLWLLFR